MILLLFEKKPVKTSAAKEDFFAPLPVREKEVARLAACAYSDAQIAEEFFINTETVKRHMASIFFESWEFNRSWN